MFIGLALAIGGAVASMYSSYEQGKAQKAQAEYNAKVAEQKAESQARALEAEQTYLVDKTRRSASTLRAQGAGSNIIQDQGSPLLMAAEAATQDAYDIQELQRQVQIARDGGDTESSLLRYKGQRAKDAAKWNMTAQGINGTSKSYSAYQNDISFRKEGE